MSSMPRQPRPKPVTVWTATHVSAAHRFDTLRIVMSSQWPAATRFRLFCGRKPVARAASMVWLQRTAEQEFYGVQWKFAIV